MFSPSFLYYSCTIPALHSFPTRRSSDLVNQKLREAVEVYFHVVGRANAAALDRDAAFARPTDRKSTRLNSSHVRISYAVFCLKKKKKTKKIASRHMKTFRHTPLHSCTLR